MPPKLNRGTNISHWLSQSKERGSWRRDRLTADDVAKLRDWGFDHLRLPIDEEQMWTLNLQREPEAFDLLAQALEWLKKAGMNAIVDLHILRSHFFNNEIKPLFTDPKEAEKFAALWGDLSAFLHAWPTDMLAYELMNEPVADNNEDWNRLAQYPYAEIRRREPQRTILLGSNRWNAVDTFDNLWIPPHDQQLILTFHFYRPFPVTHYRAYWDPIKEFQGPIQYPGVPIVDAEWAKLPATLQERLLKDGHNRYYDATVMEQDLAQPLQARQRTGHALYCGEFGAMGTLPEAARRRWYRDFLSVLGRLHIGWGNWDFRYQQEFGMLDEDRKPTIVWNCLLNR